MEYTLPIEVEHLQKALYILSLRSSDLLTASIHTNSAIRELTVVMDILFSEIKELARISTKEN